jgi:hypothetical protein
MWENIVELGRPQMAIWRMRFDLAICEIMWENIVERGRPQMAI